MTVALELADDVHEVFEDARARDTAVLRHMPDQEGWQVGFLGDTDERGSDRPHLGDAARPALDLGGGDRLHRVDDEQGRSRGLDVTKDDTQLRFIRDEQVGFKGPDAFGPPAHLRRRLLARHVQDGTAPALGRRARGLRGHIQEQRRFADAGFASQEDHRAGHDAAAEHAVQLAHSRRPRRSALPVHVTDGQRRPTRGGCGRARAARGLTRLVDRAPRPALPALAHPLRGGPPALGATVGDLLFRHDPTVTRPALICGSPARDEAGARTRGMGRRMRALG